MPHSKQLRPDCGLGCKVVLGTFKLSPLRSTVARKHGTLGNIAEQRSRLSGQLTELSRVRTDEDETVRVCTREGKISQLLYE